MQLNLDDLKLDPQSDLDALRNKAFGVGIVALLAFVGLGHLSAGPTLFRSYLIGWVFTLGIALGMTALNMIGHLSGGDWHVAMRRVFEAAGRTLPWLGVLGLALFIWGPHAIYPWAEHGKTDPTSANYDVLVAHKSVFLNEKAFLICSVSYFLIWSFFAISIGRLSERFDSTGDYKAYARIKFLSASGLIVYVLTATLASVHWLMSLDPHWFSSLFGIAFVAGHGLSAWAFSVPLLIFLKRRKPLRDLIPGPMWTKLFHDYGKMVLAFTALWAYFSVSQMLIIWSGNLPEEVVWYMQRVSHGWQNFSIFLGLGHFVIPFIILLSQDLKKQPGKLVWVAIWMLLMRWFDLFWIVVPSTSHDEIVIPHVELLAAIGFTGVWLGLLMMNLKGRALLPTAEPGLEEVVAHG